MLGNESFIVLNKKDIKTEERNKEKNDSSKGPPDTKYLGNILK